MFGIDTVIPAMYFDNVDQCREWLSSVYPDYNDRDLEEFFNKYYNREGVQ